MPVLLTHHVNHIEMPDSLTEIPVLHTQNLADTEMPVEHTNHVSDNETPASLTHETDNEMPDLLTHHVADDRPLAPYTVISETQLADANEQVNSDENAAVSPPPPIKEVLIAKRRMRNGTLRLSQIVS